jgi:hypothetical protein
LLSTWAAQLQHQVRLIATTGNVITQGIAVRLGWQEKFDWKAVATTALVAPLGKYLTNSLGLTSNDPNLQHSGLDKFGASVVSGLVSQSVRMAVYSKGKLDYASLAGDAFGSVLGGWCDGGDAGEAGDGYYNYA